MATEETKATPTTTDDQSASSKKITDATGTTWNCKRCGLVNEISSWNCIACYSTMKYSMQEKRPKKKKTKSTPKKGAAAVTKKKDDKYSKRQAKRAKLKEAENNNNNDSNNDNDVKEETETVTKPQVRMAPNLPTKMKALIKETEGKGYKLREDYDVPVPEEGELLVRSFAVAICGSDSILYNWTKDAQTIAKLPFIPGHEAAGLVVGCGPSTRMKIGDRVAIENHFFCGECYQCQEMNRKDICANLNQFGHGKGTIYGGCCEYYTVKEKYCYRLRSNISWRDAALLEPLGVAHNACERLEINSKETVLIIGCGTVGCMAVGVAKSMNAGKIIACDIVDGKLETAKKMGADVTFNSSKLSGSVKDEILKLTDNVGVGRIIECSGNSKMVNQSFSLLRKGGNIVLVGLPKAPLHVDNVLNDVIFKSIQIRTIHGRRIFHTWAQTERLVKSKKINLDPLVSHQLPLSKFEEGYKALASGTGLKVVFDLTKN